MTSAILFDMDGVLIDGRVGLRNCLQKVLARGLSTKEIDDFSRVTPLQSAFVRLSGYSIAEAAEKTNAFRDIYKRGQHLNCKLYDGVPATLDALAQGDVRMGIASFKREDYLLEICAHFGLNKFAGAICGADAENKLTKADIIKNCMAEMNVSPGDSIYVGDTENDAKSAAAIGMKFIASTYGFGFKSAIDAAPFAPLMTIPEFSKLTAERIQKCL